MEIRRSTGPLTFTEDDSKLEVSYSNRGEPFRDGVEFSFSSDVWLRGGSVQVLLSRMEVEALRDKLNEFLAGTGT